MLGALIAVTACSDEKGREIIAPDLIRHTNSSVAAAEDRYFTSDGIQIHFVDEGRGTPVLLIHGYTSDIDGGWRNRGVIDALISDGYRVIAYDNRGHGKSDKPKDVSMYGVNMVEDGRRLLDYLDIDQAHVVGYSMGARFANKLRELHPDRVMSLTVGGTGWPTASPTLTSELIEHVDQQLRDRGFLDEEERAALVAVRVSSLEIPANESELGQNKVPMLVIGGEQDRPERAQKLAEITSNAKFKMVPGDHRAAPQTPEFMEALLEFLDEHEPNRQ